MIRKILTLLLVISAFGTGVAHADHGDEGRELCEQPCQGYTYEILYDTNDGRIISVSGYDQRPSYAPKPTSYDVHDDEAVIDVTGHPQLLDLMLNMERYRVDVAAREIEAIPASEGSIMSVPGLLSPAVVFAAVIVLGAGTFILRRSLRA